MIPEMMSSRDLKNKTIPIFDHGLIVSKVSPFHNGHLDLANLALQTCKFLTWVIASSQKGWHGDLPFDIFKRHKMTSSALAPAIGLGRAQIVTVPDIGDDENWSRFVLDSIKLYKNTKDPDVYICGSVFDSRWFQAEDRLKCIIVHDRANLNPYVSGTLIRDMCMNGHLGWTKLVPEGSTEFVRAYAEKCDWSRR